jgi:hypothetical protein
MPGHFDEFIGIGKTEDNPSAGIVMTRDPIPLHSVFKRRILGMGANPR